MIHKLLSKDGARYKTYQAINANLSVHPLYTSTIPSPYIEDYLRIAFIRFRLSPHILCVEMGRWNRIPPELRTCQCETDIQNKQHALVCPLTKDIRNKYGCGFKNLSSLFVGSTAESSCSMNQEILYCVGYFNVPYCNLYLVKIFNNGFLSIVWK